MSVSRLTNPMSDTKWMMLMLGVGVVAHSTFSKTFAIFELKIFKEAGKIRQAAVLMATGLVILSTPSKNESKLITYLAYYSLSYIIVSLSAVWFSNYTQGSSRLPPYMVDMLEEAKMRMANETEKNPGKVYVPKIGYEEAIRKIKRQTFKDEKANIILVGQPGVGKSCIPERIVDDIAHGVFMEGNLDEYFKKFRFIKVDARSLIGGTILHGSLEQRIDRMVNMSKKDPSIIYFIDQIDSIVKSPFLSSSQIDIPALIAASLARNEIRVWGASTVAGYTNRIQTTELARRFFKVDIDEPTPKECYQMLRRSYSGVQRGYITISDEAIQAAVFFSNRDIRDRFLADKAKDEIETAIAEIAMNTTSTQNVTIGVKEIAAAHRDYLTGAAKSQWSVGSLVDSFCKIKNSHPESLD